MINAERILLALDSRLDHEVSLVIYDPQDMADIAFLIRHDQITLAQIEGALADAVVPDLAELRDAFERAKPRVRGLASPAP